MPNFTINVNGTNYTVGYDGTFNSPQGLLPALNNLGFGIFWIEEIGGSYVLTTVDNDDVYGVAETNADPTTTSTTTTTTTAAPIPTTTSTTTTTTAAPTTSTTTTTTTTAATTTSTTTTTTTAAPTTSTTTTTTTAATTSTTTTTTTAIATLYVDLNGANACSGIGTALPTYAYSGGTTLCDCTSLNAANATSLSAGTYFVSDGIDRRQFTSTGGGSPTLTAAGTCSACPIPTTSTTTTTTTLPPFTANIATTDAYDACNAPELTDLVFYGNGLNACDSTSVTISATLAAYLSDGQTFYINDRVDGIFYSSEWLRVGTTTTANRQTACDVCPAPITSTTTTTTSTSTTTTTLPPFTANIATTDAYDACNAPELTDLVFYGNGLNACDSTSVTISATLAAYLSDGQTFYINDRVDGIFYSSEWLRVGTTTTANRQTACDVCPPATTTTTSTTTTTTTLAGIQFGVSLNTKYGTDFLACSGTVTGVVYQKAEFGNTPTVGAQLYTSSTTGAGSEWTPSQGIGLYLMQFGGSTKWSVLVGSTGVVNTVTSCAGVSTTTTTTTTTLPPITVTATASCDGSGFSGQGRVTASSFSGGSGSYTVAAIGTSEANAISCVNNPSCPERVSIVGLTSYAWTSLANGPYYVAIKDTAGGLGYSSVATVSCNATTTTSTTTTTTTLAGVSFGVSLNTKYGTDFLACSGTVTGVVYQKAEFGNTPTVGAQLYTSSTTGSGTEWTPSQGIGLYLMQFGGSTKWSVLVGNTGLINTVTNCSGVSTTTTTTTLPPISVTATASCDGSGFSGQGRVTASSFSGGSGSYTVAAIGTSEANAISCVNNPSCPERVSIVGLSSYAWTSLANGPYYVAIKDTAGGLGYSSVATVSCNATTTTTTTTSTTTTTTTAAPTFVWNTNSAAVSANAACSATKDVYVWTFGNAWGAGIVFYAGTSGAPSQPIQPYLGGGFFYENGGQVINIDDNGVSSNLQPCPTTTTTTPATTYSQYLDCANNPYYTYNFNTGNGISDEVPDTCVFYQNETAFPSGTFFTNFIASGSCSCP